MLNANRRFLENTRKCSVATVVLFLRYYSLHVKVAQNRKFCTFTPTFKPLPSHCEPYFHPYFPGVSRTLLLLLFNSLGFYAIAMQVTTRMQEVLRVSLDEMEVRVLIEA